jgi:hypothetical protein
LPYTVQAGDDLSRIIKQFYGNPNKSRKIVDANELDGPDKIQVRQSHSRVGEDMSFRRPQAENRPILSAISCVILCTLFLCVSMLAQVTSGTISGRVQDITGAVINNATVTISNPSNGFKRQITTSDIGEFVAPNLLPGTYSITVEAPGFRNLESTGFVLNAAAKLDAGALVLSVGAFSALIILLFFCACCGPFPAHVCLILSAFTFSVRKRSNPKLVSYSWSAGPECAE